MPSPSSIPSPNPRQSGRTLCELMKRDALRRLLIPKGDIRGRAGVATVCPHRFRHTVAISYLRHDGDLFTLQELLSHSAMAMVRRYARIARTDCARAHQKASPVNN
jgi:integrase/recombinase XerD